MGVWARKISDNTNKHLLILRLDNASFAFSWWLYMIYFDWKVLLCFNEPCGDLRTLTYIYVIGGFYLMILVSGCVLLTYAGWGQIASGRHWCLIIFHQKYFSLNYFFLLGLFTLPVTRLVFLSGERLSLLHVMLLHHAILTGLRNQWSHEYLLLLILHGGLHL